MRRINWTRTETKIVQMLEDGEPHKVRAVLALLNDSQASLTALQMHISNIRKKLPSNCLIVCVQKDNTRWYQLVEAYQAKRSLT